MHRLSDMMKSLGTAEIDLCGAKVTVRALSAKDHNAIMAQTPDPPLRNGSDGRGGVRIDPMHPETVRLRNRAEAARSAILCGAAVGHHHPSLGAWRADMSSKDAYDYADDVLASASPHALQAIERALHHLSMGLDPSPQADEQKRIGTDTIPGNSSGLPPADPGQADGGADQKATTA